MVRAVVQRCEFEVAKFRLAGTGSIKARAQHEKIAADIMVIPGNLHTPVKPVPGAPAVAAGVVHHDVPPIGHAHPHAGAVRVRGACALATVLVRHKPILIEAQSAIEFVVVEQDKTGSTTWSQFDIAFEPV